VKSLRKINAAYASEQIHVSIASEFLSGMQNTICATFAEDSMKRAEIALVFRMALQFTTFAKFVAGTALHAMTVRARLLAQANTISVMFATATTRASIVLEKFTVWRLTISAMYAMGTGSRASIARAL
jgi:hypothetical protein